MRKLRIAYISFEYPPDTAVGGIATSTMNTAQMIAARGHSVEVFTSSPTRTISYQDGDVLVHRIQCEDRKAFPIAVAGIFRQRHLGNRFDVVEGPEYGADARYVNKAFPEIPLVVKLRTPAFVVKQLGIHYVPWILRIKATLGRLYTGKRPLLFWRYDRRIDPEWVHTGRAVAVIAPSTAIRDLLTPLWSLDEERVVVIPHPFAPSEDLLRIPVDTHTRRITYFGRLEPRKGVMELAAAIPAILERVPEARIRFIGSSSLHPVTKEDLRARFERKLLPYAASVEFIDWLPYDRLPAYLADTDICVLPSIWESFGYTCLEAMAAGRGLVVTHGTGMAEMVAQGRYGKVVPPGDSTSIAKTTTELLLRPAERIRLGRAARKRVLDHYNFGRVGVLQEAVYLRASASAAPAAKKM